MDTISSEQATRLPFWAVGAWPWRVWRWPWRITQSALAWVNSGLERAQQRQALARLDARQLQDMGLPPHQVDAELRKWFWQG